MDHVNNDVPGFDPKKFWYALGMRAIGGAVVTAASGSETAGLFALSTAHLTQNPPTLTVSVSKTTSALPIIKQSGYFAVNYLTSADEEIANIFCGRTALKGADRFDQRLWKKGRHGSPVLLGAIGSMECRFVESIERFDAEIVIGEIVGYDFSAEGQPLVYFGGRTFG